MQALPRVTAVVLCWNDVDRVRALLGRLRELEPAPSRVVVVDNGSHGGAAATLAAAFPEHRTIALPSNAGFAAGANRGIAQALADGAEFVWLLNSDLELPGHALAALQQAISAHPRCGMAGAVLRGADGALQAFGGGSVNLRTGMVRHVLRADGRCDYLSGACLLLRATMLRDIGMFDERYFFSFEDVDLAFRARDAGWTWTVARDCAVLHLEAASLGAWSEHRWWHLFRGLRRFLRARSPMPRTALLCRLLHHSAAMARHGRHDAWRGAWRAALHLGVSG